VIGPGAVGDDDDIETIVVIEIRDRDALGNACEHVVHARAERSIPESEEDRNRARLARVVDVAVRDDEIQVPVAIQVRHRHRSRGGRGRIEQSRRSEGRRRLCRGGQREQEQGHERLGRGESREPRRVHDENLAWSEK
jgi:hypothetical protein